MECENEILTPEKVLKILEKHGRKVTLEEAVKICEIMKMLAKITVKSYLGIA